MDLFKGSQLPIGGDVQALGGLPLTRNIVDNIKALKVSSEVMRR